MMSVLITSLWIIEFIPNVHDEKVMFYRERETNATNTFSTWLVMGLPVSIGLAISSALFGLPIIAMADLRSDAYHAFIFCFALFLGMWSNVYITQAVAFISGSPSVSVILYPGLTVSAQVME